MRGTIAALIWMLGLGGCLGGGGGSDGESPPPAEAAELSGSAAPDAAYAAAAFPDGSRAVGGAYEGALESPSGAAVPSAAMPAGFVARYEADGDLRWVRATLSDLGGRVTDLASLPDGSTVAVGYHLASAGPGGFTVAAGRPDEAVLAPPGGAAVPTTHAFAARFGPDGDLRWVAPIFSAGGASARGVAASSDGILVVGQHRGTTTFDSGGSAETELQTPLSEAMFFVARYTFDGRLSWVRTGDLSGPGSFTDGQDVAVFPDDSFAIAGTRGGALVLGPGDANETVLDSGTTSFLARYRPDGLLEWAATGQAPSTLFTTTAGVAALADGTAVLQLLSADAMVFPGAPPVAVPAGGYGAVLAWFDPLGNARTAKRVPGFPGDVNSLAARDLDVVVTGLVASPEVFGPGEPKETVVAPLGPYESLFVASYDEAGRLNWATQALNATGQHVGYAVAPLPGGPVVVSGTFLEQLTVPTSDGDLTFESAGNTDFFQFVLPVAD